MSLDLSFPEGEPQYSAFEQHCLDRMRNWFFDTNSAYGEIQGQKPQTLGIALHDSPVGMLAWQMDKLFLWTDNYPWTDHEIITWTLMNYFPGPTTGFMYYAENNPVAVCVPGTWGQQYSKVPSGFSAFPQELGIVPRSWVEKLANVQFWREHPSGGHFAMHERPEELCKDVIEFFDSICKGKALQ
jgi:hypothetical protein